MRKHFADQTAAERAKTDRREMMQGGLFLAVAYSLLVLGGCMGCFDEPHDTEDEMTDQQWAAEIQVAADENFPLLPTTPHLQSADGLTPEEELRRLLAQPEEPTRKTTP